MKRFAMAAVAALGLWAEQAGAVPIEVVGTGVLTTYHTESPGMSTDTAVNAVIQFSVYYDTAGDLGNGAPFFGAGSYISYSSPVFPTVRNISRGFSPTIVSNTTSYVLDETGSGVIFDIGLRVASIISATQGVISFLPGSTIEVGSASSGGSQTYYGNITSISTLDATPAVPEAATWAMMMVGLGVVGAAVRRRRSIHYANPVASRKS